MIRLSLTKLTLVAPPFILIGSPSTPGLEWTARNNRLEYTATGERLQYTARGERLEYTAPRD